MKYYRFNLIKIVKCYQLELFDSITTFISTIHLRCANLVLVIGSNARIIFISFMRFFFSNLRNIHFMACVELCTVPVFDTAMNNTNHEILITFIPTWYLTKWARILCSIVRKYIFYLFFFSNKINEFLFN